MIYFIVDTEKLQNYIDQMLTYLTFSQIASAIGISGGYLNEIMKTGRVGRKAAEKLKLFFGDTIIKSRGEEKI